MKLHHIEKVISGEPVYKLVFTSEDEGEVDCLRAYLGENRLNTEWTAKIDVAKTCANDMNKAGKAAKNASDALSTLAGIKWPVTNPHVLGRRTVAFTLFDEFNTKPKDQIIINPPAVILIKDGKKYVSKAHEEEFDEEKGLLMCLAKAQGITHLELKRMLKNAKKPEKKEKVKEAENDE